ncbi:MAG: hypothetical protein ACI8TX_002264 [Hyphomicrobiaceae bacterium]|jgi:hypothetical protein
MALPLIQLLVATFLAILFLQSGIDKVVDREGNVSWLKGHFAQSPLAAVVEMMVTVVTVVELAAGGLSAVGAVVLLFGGQAGVAFYGAVASAVAILMLFFGQRLAKDYEGAAVLVGYFIVTLIGIHITG